MVQQFAERRLYMGMGAILCHFTGADASQALRAVHGMLCENEANLCFSMSGFNDPSWDELPDDVRYEGAATWRSPQEAGAPLSLVASVTGIGDIIHRGSLALEFYDLDAFVGQPSSTARWSLSMVFDHETYRRAPDAVIRFLIEAYAKCGAEHLRGGQWDYLGRYLRKRLDGKLPKNMDLPLTEYLAPLSVFPSTMADIASSLSGMAIKECSLLKNGALVIDVFKDHTGGNESIFAAVSRVLGMKCLWDVA